MRTRPFVTRITVVLLPGLLALGCKKEDSPTEQASQPEAAPTSRTEADPTPDPVADASDQAGGESAEPASETSEGTSGPAPDQPGGTTANDGGTGGDAAPEGEDTPEVDVPGLLKTVRSKRTKDAKALEMLAQAEAAGADAKDLARAANARGEALYGTPDRAKAFYEWAAQKDPKYPDPLFNLAKQAVMTGDVPTTRDYLIEVHERKGSKLLRQIEFDPMWEIVKDDPEVRKLLR